MAEVVQLNKADCIEALRHNPEFFIQFFLGDALHFPVPAFHIDCFNLMTVLEIKRLTLAIPRDFAKTTLAKLACVYYFLFSDYRFIVYLSNTHGVALPAVNDIIAFMQLPNFKTLFGELEFMTEQEGRGLYKFRFMGKVCTLIAFGAGQQVRGMNVDNQRPQLAIVDDFEDAEKLDSEVLFAKSKRWLYGDFIKALDKRHNKVIQLGNMVAVNSVLREHCESPFWHSRRYGCILSDGSPLWADRWSLDEIKQDFLEYQQMSLLDVWFAEMMNLPIAGLSGVIKAKDIQYVPAINPEDVLYGFLTIDLAISENAWAHKTTVVAHVWTGEYWQIATQEGFTGIDPIALFEIVVQMCFTWRIQVVGIEDVAYQASLKFTFEHLARLRRIEGMHFVPLAANAKKRQRIVAWVAWLKDGTYRLTEGEYIITAQLLQYNVSKKKNEDDYIDSGAYGPQMIERYLDKITQPMRRRDAINTSKTCYQISEV